ncbi:hypothetical protein [Georgenia daeguensis]|uniref:CBM-cenC domain-containing protein n=1 Tax=Georgenia daeguensis TaxID=908355 RepID=A0ABP8EVW8_9MICO
MAAITDDPHNHPANDLRASSSGGLRRRTFLSGALGAGIATAFLGDAARAATPGRPVPNLLANPGFEEVAGSVPARWELFGADSQGRVATSTEHVRSGARSVRLDDTGTTVSVGLRSDAVPVEPGVTYEGSAFAHGERGQAAVYLEFWDARGVRVWSGATTVAALGGWQKVDVRGEAPQGAVSATVLLYSSSTNAGVFHFDDAALTVPAPLDPALFGPASLTAAVRGAAVHGETVVLTSRYNTPEGRLRLARFDLRTGEAVSVDDLPVASKGGQRLVSDGRYVYIGPAGSSHVWRFDPATKALERWAAVGPETTWYYDMVVDGGYLYLGTYPDCTVRRVSLADRSVQTYGRVSSSLYATSIAVDESYVYGGSAAPGGLLRWSKDGGEPVDLTAHLSDSPVGILDLVAHGGSLYVASGRQVISMQPDGSGRVVREIPEEDRYIDQLAVGADGKVYALARLTTNLYEVTAGGLTRVARPIDHVENVLLAAAPDGRLLGVSGLGHVWLVAPGGTATVWDTTTRGFGYPEVAQAMLLHSDQRVWVGGHYAMTVHRPLDGTSARFDVNGEPKALAEGRHGVVYAAMYPSGQILAIDPASLAVTPLGILGNQQMRTKAMHADLDGDQLLVASGPTGGLHTGALTFIDLRTGEFDSHREYLPEQSVMDVAVSGRTAYIVGDTYGESTGGPVRSAAQVAAVDIDTRELLWREELRPAWLSYEGVHVVGNLLYAMGRRPRGHWFAYDLVTRRIVMRGDLGGYGSFGAAGDRVLTWVHWANDIRELPGPATDDGRLLHDAVPNGWYNNPTFSISPDGRATWGMHGTDLARFPLTAPGVV